MVYPNGRTLDYNYDTGIDGAIGRLSSISDGANSGDAGLVLESYQYLGLSTIVERNHPQTGINLTLVGSSGSIGSGGDQYVGLDQFGRVVDQNWVNATTGTSTDNFTYSYDANSNVTAKNNLLNSAYSETYSYDQLNRLMAVTRGGSAYQSWNLDAQGNWSSFTSASGTQTRTANAQNQITSISGAGTPSYDSNGNLVSASLTSQPAASDTLVYDAWNRLVSVSNASGQIIAQYSYDARGYRVTVAYPQGGGGLSAGTTDYIYYSNNWQIIEVRTGGMAASDVSGQLVWSAVYINAAILQDAYTAGVIQSNSRLYFQQDVNWNTTSVVGYNPTSGTWGVVQRYVYDSYGSVTILNADWSSTPSGTNPLVNELYQGMAIDPVTGLYYARNRNYSTTLGTWISQDPLQYINGADTYQFVMSNPVGSVDPSGLSFMDWFSYVPVIGPMAQSIDYAAHGQNVAAATSFVIGLADLLPDDDFGPSEAAKVVLHKEVQHAIDEAAAKKTGEDVCNAAEEPRLVSNLKHNPNSVSPEPANAKELFNKSIVDKKGVRWAKDDNGVIHRFGKPSNGESHWNGSTAGPNPIQEQNIPVGIRRALK